MCRVTGHDAGHVAADQQGHVPTLETAINSIVAGSPTAGANLLAAENHVAEPALS